MIVKNQIQTRTSLKLFKFCIKKLQSVQSIYFILPSKHTVNTQTVSAPFFPWEWDSIKLQYTERRSKYTVRIWDIITMVSSVEVLEHRVMIQH
jgi:hypothetical protein